MCSVAHLRGRQNDYTILLQAPVLSAVVSWLYVLCCLQTAIIQLYLKRRHRQTDAAFDEQCRFNHESRGVGNLYPRSFWLMKKIAGVTEARKVQVSGIDTAASYQHHPMSCASRQH